MTRHGLCRCQRRRGVCRRATCGARRQPRRSPSRPLRSMPAVCRGSAGMRGGGILRPIRHQEASRSRRDGAAVPGARSSAGAQRRAPRDRPAGSSFRTPRRSSTIPTAPASSASSTSVKPRLWHGSTSKVARCDSCCEATLVSGSDGPPRSCWRSQKRWRRHTDAVSSMAISGRASCCWATTDGSAWRTLACPTRSVAPPTRHPSSGMDAAPRGRPTCGLLARSCISSSARQVACPRRSSAFGRGASPMHPPFDRARRPPPPSCAVHSGEAVIDLTADALRECPTSAEARR